MDLAGKSIVVTGASSGLGRAICSACAKAGARVILVARHPERLAEAARECGEGKHLVFPADLSDLDAIPRLVRAISKETGPLSGVVHSAGLHQPAPLRAVNAKHLEAIFQPNAIAGVMLVKGLAAQGV
ncbi:MAG: SDR family NAD(P)-dependent oxidoreductase, partial [Planctomycetota bacterium]|nr:SDR family NAD(P)-dependent oxidoreductase [Planctomycetota bacterium]